LRQGKVVRKKITYVMCEIVKGKKRKKLTIVM
jgi:hypothetical protein